MRNPVAFERSADSHASTYCEKKMDGGELEVENVDPEQQLLEDACTYLTSKQYPAHVKMNNEKRSIRRKVEKLVIKDGELFTRR